MDLLRQFFKFDKLMKDRLVAAFFFLGLVVVVATFFATIVLAFRTMDHSFFKGLMILVIAFFKILFLFVTLRLTAELMVTIFHINDNLSPDGGKSDTAELDVIEAARKAAQQASVATKSAFEKTKTKIAEVRDNKDSADDESYPDYEDPTPNKKPAAKKPGAKTKPATKKSGTASKPAAQKKTTAKKTAAKKPAARKTTPKKSSAPKKPTAKPKK